MTDKVDLRCGDCGEQAFSIEGGCTIIHKDTCQLGY
jgi:hypothetical protein